MQAMKSHVSKGDTVMVVAGKEKNKTGKVLKLLPKKNGVIVEGLNLVKRHVKARGNEAGAIKEKEAAIHISNVMPYCPKCAKPVRTKITVLENGEKQRNCVKCGASIEK
ncbi:50S ribosomal protein L24 [Oryzomonas sagensis]|uniref:Large ribosomal subunit protein uL24 n=1 Tax=Oryzomonas sagensis TaxID=2603857 RepID=A0ABQ6TLQ9_9BACT|nr:50S ribosomal protein L24 [Oryzomonas sagensis]KAB0669345.1 50S ribosomal protein L24 [Oryzomonas sagensis]